MFASSGVFIVPNGTLIAEIVAFVIVLAIVWKYILPPLNKMLGERQEQIRTEMAAADEARDEARRADEDRREALEEARLRAREIVEQAQRTAERLGEEAHARGEREYERLVSSAEEQVRLSRQRALEEAAQHLADVVVDVVEHIIGREMDAAAHADLIDAAVSALAAEPGVVES